MQEFFSFRKMITPTIIRFIFWIGSGLMVIAGLVALFSNLGRYGSAASAIGGLLTIFIGPVVVRIACEQVILFFRINETLSDIRSDLQDVKSHLNPPQA
jgi:hypothetical protein